MWTWWFCRGRWLQRSALPPAVPFREPFPIHTRRTLTSARFSNFVTSTTRTRLRGCCPYIYTLVQITIGVHESSIYVHVFYVDPSTHVGVHEYECIEPFDARDQWKLCRSSFFGSIRIYYAIRIYIDVYQKVNAFTGILRLYMVHRTYILQYIGIINNVWWCSSHYILLSILYIGRKSAVKLNLPFS